ncbi:MAG: hypothetical protein ACRDXD_11735 [Acidimicrobiia bacterium]
MGKHSRPRRRERGIDETISGAISETFWFIFSVGALVAILALLAVWAMNVDWSDWTFGQPQG